MIVLFIAGYVTSSRDAKASTLGVMMPVGVTGVMAGDGPSDRMGSLSGLSSDTSSVASLLDKINQIHYTIHSKKGDM